MNHGRNKSGAVDDRTPAYRARVSEPDQSDRDRPPRGTRPHADELAGQQVNRHSEEESAGRPPGERDEEERYPDPPERGSSRDELGPAKSGGDVLGGRRERVT